MVEDIDKERIIEKLKMLKGRMADKRIRNIADEFIKLGNISCVEGLYGNNDKQFVVIYKELDDDNYEECNKEFQEINDKVLKESKYTYDIMGMSMEELINPYSFFGTNNYYAMKRLANADCLYANKSVKSLVRRIKD